jgi:hypothetical protein
VLRHPRPQPVHVVRHYLHHPRRPGAEAVQSRGRFEWDARRRDSPVVAGELCGGGEMSSPGPGRRRQGGQSGGAAPLLLTPDVHRPMRTVRLRLQRPEFHLNPCSVFALSAQTLTPNRVIRSNNRSSSKFGKGRSKKEGTVQILEHG